MASQVKSAQKSRATKTSKGLNKGARKFPGGGMTDLQKILINNGGMAHSRLRAGKSVLTGSSRAPKRRPREEL